MSDVEARMCVGPDLFRLPRHEGRETTVCRGSSECYYPILIAPHPIEQHAPSYLS